MQTRWTGVILACQALQLLEVQRLFIEREQCFLAISVSICLPSYTSALFKAQKQSTACTVIVLYRDHS